MPSADRVLRPLTPPLRELTPAEQELTFAVLGDCQPTLARMPHSRATETIMRELRLLQPQFVLFTGDRIWGFGESTQEIRNGYDRFLSLARSTEVPFYAVPGNHEFQSDPAAIAAYEALCLPAYGSFDSGGYHFVGLNTEEFCREGRVVGEQLEWLQTDLAKRSDAAATFVFMHRPLHSWFQGDFNPDDAALPTGSSDWPE